MKICYLIHGIKTIDPDRSSISFLKYLIKLKVVVLSYLYVPVILAPITSIINYFIVRRFVRTIKPGSILVGHSNGCTIAYGVSRLLYTHGLVLINPALNKDVEFDPFIKFIHIYYSHNDRVTWLSRLMPFSLWGSMGTVGYQGNDPRVKQYDMGVKHSDIGDAEIAVVWGPKIADGIMTEVSRSVSGYKS